MSRKRVTYRPSKTGSVAGGVVGCVFVLIGLFVVIPQFAMVGGFGLIFGIFWTILAAVIAGTNFYSAFGKKYIGPEIHIEDEAAQSEDPEERLRKLRELYDQRLITEEEYEAKRQEILGEL